VQRATLDLIKGLGGALLREKIVAAASRRFIVVVDNEKFVDRLTKAWPRSAASESRQVREQPPRWRRRSTLDPELRQTCRRDWSTSVFLIDDDDKAPARRRHDLLAQQRAAEPLDQIERCALHLVGAIDREIDPALLSEACERNAEPTRQGGRVLGGRNGHDGEPARDARGQLLDDKAGGRSGAETDDHPTLDKFTAR